MEFLSKISNAIIDNYSGYERITSLGGYLSNWKGGYVNDEILSGAFTKDMKNEVEDRLRIKINSYADELIGSGYLLVEIDNKEPFVIKGGLPSAILGSIYEVLDSRFELTGEVWENGCIYLTFRDDISPEQIDAILKPIKLVE